MMNLIRKLLLDRRRVQVDSVNDRRKPTLSDARRMEQEAIDRFHAETTLTGDRLREFIRRGGR